MPQQYLACRLSKDDVTVLNALSFDEDCVHYLSENLCDRKITILQQLIKKDALTKERLDKLAKSHEAESFLLMLERVDESGTMNYVEFFDTCIDYSPRVILPAVISFFERNALLNHDNLLAFTHHSDPSDLLKLLHSVTNAIQNEKGVKLPENLFHLIINNNNLVGLGVVVSTLEKAQLLDLQVMQKVAAIECHPDFCKTLQFLKQHKALTTANLEQCLAYPNSQSANEMPASLCLPTEDINVQLQAIDPTFETHSEQLDIIAYLKHYFTYQDDYETLRAVLNTICAKRIDPEHINALKFLVEKNALCVLTLQTIIKENAGRANKIAQVLCALDNANLLSISYIPAATKIIHYKAIMVLASNNCLRRDILSILFEKQYQKHTAWAEAVCFLLEKNHDDIDFFNRLTIHSDPLAYAQLYCCIAQHPFTDEEAKSKFIRCACTHPNAWYISRIVKALQDESTGEIEYLSKLFSFGVDMRRLYNLSEKFSDADKPVAIKMLLTEKIFKRRTFEKTVDILSSHDCLTADVLDLFVDINELTNFNTIVKELLPLCHPDVTDVTKLDVITTLSKVDDKKSFCSAMNELKRLNKFNITTISYLLNYPYLTSINDVLGIIKVSDNVSLDTINELLTSPPPLPEYSTHHNARLIIHKQLREFADIPSFRKVLTVVFDIDGVIASHDSLSDDERLMLFFDRAGAILEAQYTIYYIFPGIKELLKLLYSMENVEVVFFSAGSVIRNQELVHKLLYLSLGKVQYQQVRNEILIKSNVDMVVETKNGQQKLDTLYQFKNNTQRSYKKDLFKALQLHTKFKYVIFFDDNESNIHSFQEANYVRSPLVSTQHFRSLGNDAPEASKISRRANSVIYMAGITQACIEKINAIPPAQWLFDTCYKRVQYDLHTFFKPTKSSRKEAEYYQRGLRALQSVNPDFRFITQSYVDEITQSESPDANTDDALLSTECQVT